MLTASFSPDRTKEPAVSYFFLLGLTLSFMAAHGFAARVYCVGYAWSNFEKKNKRLLAVFSIF